MKQAAKISAKLIESTWHTLAVIGAIFGAGVWYIQYQQSRDVEQQNKIVNEIITQIKPELQVLKVDISKVNLQLELARKRDTMQVNSFNRYRMSQAKSEREQIEIYKDIQKQLEQRQEYFYNDKSEMYIDSLPADTLKKKYQMMAKS